MTVTGSTLEIESLRGAFLDGRLAVIELADQVLARIAQSDDPAIWISRSSETAIRARARELDAAVAADPSTVARLPLFGIPFAVKRQYRCCRHTNHGRVPRLCLHPD